MLYRNVVDIVLIKLVFGRNVNMPTVLEDKLPALESNTSSDIIRKNIEALHSARKNFI